MKATRWRRVSAFALLLSVAFLVATLLLPLLRLPETVQTVEPSSSNSSQSYQVYGYGIPPVNQGTIINVTLSAYKPYTLEYSLSPTIGNKVLAAISLGKVGSSPATSFAATAAGTYSLELTVIAYNGSGFHILYTGVWSPFNDLGVYIAPAVFLVAASLAAFYYFGTRIGRQLNEEQVERELEEARRRKV